MTTIKELRQSRGLTQDDLAENIGCSRENISRYESGTRRPRPEVAEKIGEVFGLTRSQLWEMFYAGKEQTN